MTQTNKIFNFLNTFMLIIFFIEMLILFLNIDIIPLLLIGVVCGLIIIIRNSNDDFFYGSTEVTETKSIFKFIFFSLLDILIFTIFLIYGIENISNVLIYLLNSSHIFRFVLYGVIFPIILSYFMAWFWMDSKPNLSILYALIAPNSLGTYYKFLFANLCVGLLVCMNWETYYSFVSYFVNFFSR